MSGIVAIRAALEVAVAAMSPALATAYENAPYTPVVGTPYQMIWLMPATPDNREFSGVYRQDGLLQVDLKYPLNAGPAVAAARAELIRSTFSRGASFTASGVVVTINGTPEIMPARIEEDRYVLPVRVPFYAHIRS